MDELKVSGNYLNIVILDACRDNPFGWNRSASRGLTVVSTQPAGSIVVYATSAGSVAQDGPGRNWLFTSALLDHISVPDIPVEEVFKRTGAAVQSKSNGSQVPAIYNQFFGQAYLFGAPGDDASAETATTDGRMSSEVTSQPTSREDPKTTSTWSTAAARTGGADIGTSTAYVGENMVRVPGGSFLMGSPRDEHGRVADEPQHRVTVSAFYIGTYEVTRAEWNEIMGNGGTSFPDEEMELPATRVTWEKAVEYCNRRSIQEGLTPSYSLYGETDPDKWIRSRVSTDASNIINVSCDFSANGYRLPTEAEWCWDRYRYYLSLPLNNPKNKYGARAHVIRGGGYRSTFTEIRSAYRGVSKSRAGFRVAQSIPHASVR